MLALQSKKEYEYVCLVNVRNGTYSSIGMENNNSHKIPEIADFDTVTKHIRDTFVSPDKRDEYYKNASLDVVLANMTENDSEYIYRYTLQDGIREACFTWYDANKTELLMTVYKVQE